MIGDLARRGDPSHGAGNPDSTEQLIATYPRDSKAEWRAVAN